MAKLTELQYKFAHLYIANGFNAYQAALGAGYSESFAKIKSHELPANPRIQKRITEITADEKSCLGLSWEYKAGKLKKVIDRYIPDDDKIDMKTDKVKVALAAIAELNKMQGDYAPDKKLSVNVDMTKEKLIEAKRVYEEY
ncbi:MAG: terminase small subunit [Candidatus Gracilibacteria bacterium]|jgi:hypothetical protein